MRLPEGRPNVRVESAMMRRGWDDRPSCLVLTSQKVQSPIPYCLEPITQLGLLPRLVLKFLLGRQPLPPGGPFLHDDEDGAVADEGDGKGENYPADKQRETDVDKVVPLQDLGKLEVLSCQRRREVVRIAQDPEADLELPAQDQRPDRDEEIVQLYPDDRADDAAARQQ